MIYGAYIRKDYEDGPRINGVGFVIEPGDDDKNSQLMLLFRDEYEVWSIDYLDNDGFMGKEGQFTHVYRINFPRSIIRVTYDKPVYNLQGEEYEQKAIHALVATGCMEDLDRLFVPTMGRFKWIKTKDAIMMAPWLGVVDGGKSKEVKE